MSVVTKFWIIVLPLAVLVRLLTGYFAYGPQAIDDYKHGIIPATQYSQSSGSGTADLSRVELPNYRSPFLTYYLAPWPKVAGALGWTRPVAQARAIEMGLGLISLLGFFGIFWIYQSRGPADVGFYFLASLLYAFHPLLPFASTRAFGESACMPFVLLAFGAFSLALHEDRDESIKRSRRFYLLSVFFLLVAIFLRFQVGIFALPLGVFLLWRRDRTVLILSAALAALAVLAQASLDLSFGRAALSSLREYLRENSGGAVKYGVSPWYNTWLTFLGFALVPFSLLVLIRKLSSWWKTELPLLFCICFFLTVHCFVPHKEERFLYPILPLAVVLVARAWAINWGWSLERFCFRPLMAILCGFGAFIVAFSNPQSGIVTPLAEEGAREKPTMFLDLESNVGRSFIKEHFIQPPDEYKKFHEVQDGDQSKDFRWVLLLPTGALVPSAVQDFLRLAKLSCGPQKVSQSWLDSWLVKLNPKWNERRRPTAYFVCDRDPAIKSQ